MIQHPAAAGFFAAHTPNHLITISSAPLFLTLGAAQLKRVEENIL